MTTTLKGSQKALYDIAIELTIEQIISDKTQQLIEEVESYRFNHEFQMCHEDGTGTPNEEHIDEVLQKVDRLNAVLKHYRRSLEYHKQVAQDDNNNTN